MKKIRVKFLKNFQLVFAIVLILFIPTSLLLYNFFLVGTIKENMDFEYRDKASLSISIAREAIKEDWPDKELMQKKIKKIGNNNPQIEALDVLVPVDNSGDFKICCSLSPQARGETLSQTLNNIAWNEEFIAFTTNSSASSSLQKMTREDASSPTRYQMVMRTFSNDRGEKVGMLSMKISLEDVEKLNKKLIFWSWIISILLVITLLLFVATNFKLFRYVVGFQKLREVDEMKDEFISIASHELRAPLTAIRGFTSMMQEVLNKKKKLTKNEKQIQDFANSIDSSSKRLGDLVEDMLDVSRIEQGRMSFEHQAIKPIDTVKEIIEQFSFQAEQKGLDLRLDKVPPEAKNKKIYVDEDKFKQVVVNLVSNSVKYTEEGEVKIKLKLDERKERMEIKVKDTGIGMDAKERENLFQKFYRVQTDKTRNITGTGLGLWLTKQIVEKMDGEIFVDSIKGEGSEFTLSFPLAQEKKKKDQDKKKKDQ